MSVSYMKKFIEDNVGLIENNEFNRLYSIIDELWVSSLTQLLYSVGIDPLPYLDVVPKEFAYRCTLSDVYIPSNITDIYAKAFQRCKCFTVVIEEGCKNIYHSAFAGCDNLVTVSLPSTLTTIDEVAFFGSTSLHSIKFNGTFNEWCAIYKGNSWLSRPKQEEVILECTDGRYRCNGEELE